MVMDLYGDEDEIALNRGSAPTFSSEDGGGTRRAMRKPWCILSPVGKKRLIWDCLTCMALLLEVWLIPFELVFVASHTNEDPWRILSLCITGCFAVDIFLNFNTGYIYRDKLVMTRRRIASWYWKSWFWIDLMATIPWDVIFSSVQVNAFSSLRIARTVKILKTMRVLRMLRAIKLVRNMTSFHWFMWSRRLAGFVPMALALLLVAHFNGCIKGAIDDVEPSVDDEPGVMRAYYKRLSWALLALATASPTDLLETEDPGKWTFAMFILLQSLAMFVVLALWLLWTGYHTFQEEADLSIVKKDAMRYFRHHGVSVEMQLQVLYCLHETSRAHTMRSRFRQLMMHHLPDELRRAISEELWTARLMTLGLILRISPWHADFITELALIVHEEILASKTVLCREGNASIAAYHIVKGRMIVRSAKRGTLPLFSDGMWVGEQALVNPMLRRNYTAIAKTLVHIMAVPGEAFQSLLVRLDIFQRYQEMCLQQLTSGLCGRCGVLGDHFTHRCPTINHQNIGPQRATTKLLETGHRWQKWLKRKGRKLQRKATLTELSSRADSDPNIGSDFEVAEDMDPGNWSPDEHMLFLSHHKEEAGTEAALMRTELALMTAQDPNSMFHNFQVPVFLDTEDLTDLQVLQKHVRMSHNLALLLTRDVLTRPWVIIEIVTAVQSGVRVIPVMLEKGHNNKEFEFPTQDYYTTVLNGTFLSESGIELLRECAIDVEDVESALRTVFKRIAIPFSPHRKETIRRAELHALMVQCRIRDDGGEIMMSETGDY